MNIVTIVGTGRNGSTLLARMLDGAKNVYVHPIEERILTIFDDLGAGKQVSRFTTQNCRTYLNGSYLQPVKTKDLLFYLKPSLDMLHDEHYKLLPEDIYPGPFDFNKHFPATSYSLKEFLPQYLRSLALHTHPSMDFDTFIMKSIETPYVAQYEHLFPDMKFIHLIRNPVAVCSSQKRSIMHNKKQPSSYLGNDWLECMMTKRWLPHLSFIATNNNQSKHLVVRYEDMVESPINSVNTIVERFDISKPPRPDYQTEFCDLDLKGLRYNPSKKGIQNAKRIVNNFQKKNNYSQILTSTETDLINRLSSKFNYLTRYMGGVNTKSGLLLLKVLIPNRWDFANTLNFKGILRFPIAFIARRILFFK